MPSLNDHVANHTFTCEVCSEVCPDDYCTDPGLSMDVYMCNDCDDKCAADKTRHHAPVEIPIGHLEYILWTMNNMAKDEPFEGVTPGNAKKWLKESIDLIKQSMPEEGGE